MTSHADWIESSILRKKLTLNSQIQASTSASAHWSTMLTSGCLESHNPEDFSKEEDTENESKKRPVDKAARHVTKNISSNITFKLVKYFSLWSDITKACTSEAVHEEYAYALSLPSMIELGSYDPRVLELMSLGINRSIALKLRKDLPKTVENVEAWLQNYNTTKLSPLLRRYLERSGLTRRHDE